MNFNTFQHNIFTQSRWVFSIVGITICFLFLCLIKSIDYISDVQTIIPSIDFTIYVGVFVSMVIYYFLPKRHWSVYPYTLSATILIIIYLIDNLIVNYNLYSLSNTLLNNVDLTKESIETVSNWKKNTQLQQIFIISTEWDFLLPTLFIIFISWLSFEVTLPILKNSTSTWLSFFRTCQFFISYTLTVFTTKWLLWFYLIMWGDVKSSSTYACQLAFCIPHSSKIFPALMILFSLLTLLYLGMRIIIIVYSLNKEEKLYVR